MDPHFSVLLNDKTAGGDKCKPHKNQTKKIVEIVVPIVVGLILLAALLVILRPRIDRWWKARTHKRIASSSSSGLDGVDMDIEKRGDMETHTASGNYRVRM
eukprot:Phypoly_transcript_18140.p2 GENE.Phypoly_transcript_18140~~Phypoly_transcript_18140.p2  ORF type:complete len:101 (+),score=13.12 Phypoly_transcript_18140:247-549(+)